MINERMKKIENNHEGEPPLKRLTNRVILITEAHSTYNEAYSGGKFEGDPERDISFLDPPLSERGYL